MRALALLIGVTCAAATGRAEADLSWGGHVKGFFFEQITEPFPIDRAGARLQLAAWGGLADPVEYYAAIDFEIDNRLLTTDASVRRGEGFDIFPVELYLNLSLGPVELRAGQQFIFWGRTDWVNPTDVITGWDYGNMASEIEDYRMAPLALRLNWYVIDELKLDLVWVPVFRPNRIPMTAPDSAGGLPVIDGSPGLPELRLENGEFGARISHSVSAWAFDWAIAVYRGFDKLPAISMEPVFDPPGAGPPMPIALRWNRRYDPLTMIGVDAAKAFGPVVIKAEGAVKITDDTDGTDPTLRNSRIEWVVGVEYAVTEDLTFGGQYIGVFLIDYSRPAERTALTALMGAPPAFVDKKLDQQASLQMRARFFTDFSAQVIGQYDFVYRDFFLIAFVGWDVADALKLFAGAVAFAGESKTTPFGRQVDNSRGFIELKYSF